MGDTTSDFEFPLIDPYDQGLHGVNQPANIAFVQILWASLGLLTAIVVSIHLTLRWLRSRRKAALADAPKESNQDVWSRPIFPWVPNMKQRFFYAPMFRLRRARRLPLFGTLPTRSHAVFLVFFAASNIAYMFAVNFGNQNIYALLAEIRGRTGTLAVANMVPLVLLIGHNNPLTSLMHLKYDSCIMLHRWIGRIIIFEALLHGIAWAVVHVADRDWASVWKEICCHGFITAGFVGWAGLAVMLVSTLNPVRSAYYEAFVIIHIITACAIVAATIVHCKLSEFELPQMPWIIAVAILWALERLLRTIRLVRHTFTRQGRAVAIIEAISGSSDVCRITMHLPRRVDIHPGSHAYIRLVAVRFWETHPFSIAWVKHQLSPIVRESLDGSEGMKMTTSLSFVVGAHQGFTRDLFSRVSASGGRLKTTATFEGPYDGCTSLDSYGHVVLVAGATGITHLLGYVRRLVLGHASRTTAAKRIVLVWIVRHSDALEWIQPWLTEIMELSSSSGLLTVKAFVTQERPQHSSAPVVVSSTTKNVVSCLYERPDVSEILQAEVGAQIGAMFVMVCGSGSLSDSVRAAVRQCQSSGNEDRL
ncbi:ferric reductase [Colletotrichum truncatum]|uniref:Ferric reductase n=1 Tax=Colletotrichum truncatum TaxID=5467 RepID=A0ACC3YVZ3_COLTU|nr:ferric reductase [Colletotrichum truncatum]KAF6791227.1 ferric reductase [Colletotrichum truncatum]